MPKSELMMTKCDSVLIRKDKHRPKKKETLVNLQDDQKPVITWTSGDKIIKITTPEGVFDIKLGKDAIRQLQQALAWQDAA